MKGIHMKKDLETLNKLKELVYPYNLSKSVEEWKNKGGKVVGWTCNYVPEELIHAIGALPYRIILPYSVEVKEANAYLHPNICTYCRVAFQAAFEEKLSFLDAVALGSTCDSMRRLGELWEIYLAKPSTYFLSIPHLATDEAVEFFADELQGLKSYLERLSGIELTNESLHNSIALYNQSRKLLGQLYQLREQDPPMISGTEIMEILNAAVWMPREDFNRSLEELIREATSRPVDFRAVQPRILVNGTILSDSGIIEHIESAGARVVADELCTGYRYWAGEVSLRDKESALQSLARRYLASPLCPRTMVDGKRWEDIREQIRVYRVDGVIHQTIKYCAPHGYDAFQLSKELNKSGIPTLEINLDYGAQITGQIKTRVQAFVEMLSTPKRDGGKERATS